MEGQFQTSFIPKQPIVQKTSGFRPRESNLVLRITVIILIATVAAAIGIFAYINYLQYSNDKLRSDLDVAIRNLQPSLITSIARLDTRIKSAKTLLDQHVALSNFFTLLNRATLTTVRFSSFHYTATGQKISVTMGGEAQNFAAIVLQAEEFSKKDYTSYISNPLFSNLNLDKSGNVTFNFTADLNPQSFLYKSKFNTVIQAGDTGPTVPVEQSVSSTTASTTKR
jgi:hypothetical protein